MKLSIVVPAYNEEISFPKFYPDLIRVLKSCVKDDYEVIVVNDGSRDGTLSLLHEMSAKDTKLRVVNLSRNFGKEIATTAGIHYAKGDAIVLIDADGQHPPELIKTFLKEWESGSQVVVGVRESNQKEGIVKRYGSRLFYRLFNATSETVLIPGATDFRLIDKVVRDEFITFSERYRITRGLIDWMGFERTLVPFHAKARIGGEASYKVSGLIKLALNSFVSLSMAPLYTIGYAGALITLLSFLAGIFVLIEEFLLSDPLGLNITGTAMLSIMLLFLVGIILTAQGLISIYLSHIHAQTQKRPLFIVNGRGSVHLHE